MSEKYETLLKALSDNIKQKIPGTTVYFDENDLKSGARLVLEHLGTNDNTVRFNIKVCGQNCFSIKQVAQLIALEKEIKAKLPFNRSNSQKGNKITLSNFDYYIIDNQENANRETKDSTTNYTRTFQLIVTEKD